MDDARPATHRSFLEVAIAVGFVFVAIALWIARANPATSYESSVYAGTPRVVWLGFAVGLAIAVGVALTCRGRHQGYGIALGGTVVTAIVALPSIRNYRFSGMGDAMTHLGWSRDVTTGDLLPHELFYPAVHSMASVFHYLGGVPIERALLITLVVVFVPFVIFVPLAVRLISGEPLAIGAGAVVTWMVLPINNIATHLGIHTNSNALFLVPAALFAILAYLRRPAGPDRLPLGLSPYSVLVYVLGIGLLLLHPQQMINVVVVVGTIAGLQTLLRVRHSEHSIAAHPPMYTHAVVLGTLFTVWVTTRERFRTAVVGLVDGLLTDEVGAGAEVDQREASLGEIGGSLFELGTVLFLEAAVIGLLAGGFVLASWIGWTRLDEEQLAIVTYLGVALVPLGVILGFYFIGTPTMAFRQIGFIFALVTILAGVALAHAGGSLVGVLGPAGGTSVLAVGLGVLLVFGLLTLFASPLFFSPGQHVSEEKLSGYDASFEHAAEDRPHVGLGFDPYRFDHGLYGAERDDALSGATLASGEVDPEPFNEGAYGDAYHDVEYYLTLTEFDLTRELAVYDELHYTEAGFEGLAFDENVDKVVANGEFELYAIDASDD